MVYPLVHAHRVTIQYTGCLVLVRWNYIPLASRACMQLNVCIVLRLQCSSLVDHNCQALGGGEGSFENLNSPLVTGLGMD